MWYGLLHMMEGVNGNFRLARANADAYGVGAYWNLKSPISNLFPLVFPLSMWEVCCRWWEGKGDVWRLLQDMAVTIDGRTWPAEEEAHVRPLPLGTVTTANLQR